MADRWNPWRSLRERTHIVFGLEDLPPSVDGFYARWSDGVAVIAIDRKLPRRLRRATLAHELIHDERRGGADAADMPSSWRAVVARDERQVDDEVARRLVPDDELRYLLECLTEMGLPVEVWDVARQFDVPDTVAKRAIARLGLSVTTPAHAGTMGERTEGLGHFERKAMKQNARRALAEQERRAAVAANSYRTLGRPPEPPKD